MMIEAPAGWVTLEELAKRVPSGIVYKYARENWRSAAKIMCYPSSWCTPVQADRADGFRFSGGLHEYCICKNQAAEFCHKFSIPAPM